MRLSGGAILLALALGTAAVASTSPIARATRELASSLTGAVFTHEVARGESLVSIGARFGIDARELAAANGLNADEALAPGRLLHLDNRHVVPAAADVEIVINVPQRMLFVGGAESEIAGYPVGLGRRDWPTPLGDFTIVLTEEDPVWDVPVSIQEEMRREGREVLLKVAPGPANPLGAHWLGLSLGAVGIHGTNAPTSIFRHTTHGCIRMHPEDVASVYGRVRIGTMGRIVYEPVLLAQTAEGVFLEAHADVYRRVKEDPLDAVREMALAAGLSDDIDWGEASRVLAARSGVARPIGCR